MPRTDISVRDAARLLGTRLDAVYALIWAGKMPATKRDGRWRISAAAVGKRKMQKRGNALRR
jgi:excisionase family DNA binding protein